MTCKLSILLSILPPLPAVALAVAGLSLVVAPRVLPTLPAPPAASPGLGDLPYRMITGALLTVGVTAAAALLGEVWSGLLAVFPIIGLVLAVFTHRAQGAAQVAQVYRGMVRGLYSFASFFLALSLLWPRIDFWGACLAAVGAALAVQLAVQRLAVPNAALQPAR